MSLRQGIGLGPARDWPDRQDSSPESPHVSASSPPPAIQDEILGSSSPIRELRESLRRVARQIGRVRCVLLTGGPGTGKEVAARSLYRLSGLSGRFVPLNLADPTVAASRLFGHERGAFTSARIC